MKDLNGAMIAIFSISFKLTGNREEKSYRCRIEYLSRVVIEFKHLKSLHGVKVYIHFKDYVGKGVERPRTGGQMYKSQLQHVVELYFCCFEFVQW